MGPRLEFDELGVRGLLERLQTFDSDDGRRVMERIGRAMLTSMRLRFRRQAGPDGQAWWPSDRAQREGGQTLRASGRLLRSLTWRAGADWVEAGTNVPYAAAHQFGIRRIVNVRAHRRLRARTHRERGAVSVASHPVRAHLRMMFLPARPYAGFDAEDRAEILEILREGIARLARK